VFSESEYAVIWEVYATLLTGLASHELADQSFVQTERVVRETLDVLLTEAAPKWQGERRDKALHYLLDETFGLGPLEALLASSRVSEVRVESNKRVLARIDGRFQQTAVRFRDDGHRKRIQKRALASKGVGGADVWVSGQGFSIRKG